MDLAPQADPTDGLLEVLRLDPVGRTHLLALFRRLFCGPLAGSLSERLNGDGAAALDVDAVPGAVRRLLPAPG